MNLRQVWFPCILKPTNAHFQLHFGQKPGIKSLLILEAHFKISEFKNKHSADSKNSVQFCLRISFFKIWKSKYVFKTENAHLYMQIKDTLRELFFAGTNFFGLQFWDFLRELNFADFSLERKLDPFCELFDLCFLQLKIFVGT